MKKSHLFGAVCACSFTLVSRFAVGAAIATGLVFGLATESAQGAPIQLNATDFANEISGLSVKVEDFEGFPLGSQTSPLTLVNATYMSDLPLITNGFILPTNQLVNNGPDDVFPGRIFNAFAPGTTLFGLDIAGFSSEDVLRTTAVGTSGMLTVEQTIGSLNGFVGFQDALGLTSVTFLNLGTTGGVANYAFDNVTTGIIPIPPALLLFGSGLLGLIGISRRKKLA